MTFIDDIERVEEMVVDWAVGVILDVTDLLMPDGRPYGMTLQPDELQIANYLELQGNSEAWIVWLSTQIEGITQKLTESGLPQDEIVSVHPFNPAVVFALNYSAHMEELIGKKNGIVSN